MNKLSLLSFRSNLGSNVERVCVVLVNVPTVLTAPKVSAGTNFVGDTTVNTDGQNVITKTGSGAGDNLFHGVASKANVWASPRTITVNGSVKTTSAVTGIDGSGNITIPLVFNGSGTTTIGSLDIGSDAVEEAKIKNGAVTADKLKSSASSNTDRAVTTNHIRNEAVTHDKLAADCVDETNLDESKTYTMAGLIVDDITINATTISTSTNSPLTLDVDGDINLDTNIGLISLKDNTLQFGTIQNASSCLLYTSPSPRD